MELLELNFGQTELFIAFINEHNATLAFMVLDDSFGGITNYGESKVVLLDAIKNENTVKLNKVNDTKVQELTRAVSEIGKDLPYKKVGLFFSM